MNAVFSLVEQLVALGRPTIVGLQSLLGVTLSITVQDTTAPTIGQAGPDKTIECSGTPNFTAPVSQANQYWSIYEAHQSSGLVASVDFREPRSGASKHEPLLVVTLRDAPVRLQDLSQKYGRGRISDMSHHHPSFVGYTYVVRCRQVAFKIDSKSERVLGFSIDYSVAPGGSNKQGP